MTGLWNGIANKVNWIIGKIQGMGSSVMSAIKGIFGIHSPSTRMRDEVGKNLALGLGEGFVDKMKDVKRQMTSAIPTSFDADVELNGKYSGGKASGNTVTINQNNTFTTRSLSAYEVLVQTSRLNKQLGGLVG